MSAFSKAEILQDKLGQLLIITYKFMTALVNNLVKQYPLRSVAVMEC